MLKQIDWITPWTSCLQEYIQRLLAHEDWLATLNSLAQERSLGNHRDLPLQFVDQSALPAGTAYESFISTTGKVPTRDNLHDFFNGVIWLCYPQIKKQLNALQAGEIMQSDSVTAKGRRGKLRDALTIFDENAAIFACADSALSDALRAHRWNDLFVKHRASFGRVCKAFLFGHALMEKLTAPYKAITAHAWIVKVTPEFFALPEKNQREQLDQQVAAQLQLRLTTSAFTPLPVLGIPGWAAQQDCAYYSDQAVFRPKNFLKSGFPSHEKHRHPD